MAKFKIIVDDAEKYNAFELKRYIEAFKQNGLNETRALLAAQERAPKKDKGAVYTEANEECPEGLSNCRNCGDPSFKEECDKKGHCPDCGTKHGIAPDSIVKQNGFKLEKM